MLKTYRVVWEIDVEANNPLEAAKAARRHQRAHRSIATIFKVRPFRSKRVRTVDLLGESK